MRNKCSLRFTFFQFFSHLRLIEKTFVIQLCQGNSCAWKSALSVTMFNLQPGWEAPCLCSCLKKTNIKSKRIKFK